MYFILVFFCLFMMLAGSIILIQPNYVISPIKKYRQATSLYIAAILVRALIGLLLLLFASSSSQPLLLQVIGSLFILAAATFTLIGHQRFIQLIDWACQVNHSLARVMGVVTLLFALIMYSAL